MRKYGPSRRGSLSERITRSRRLRPWSECSTGSKAHRRLVPISSLRSTKGSPSWSLNRRIPVASVPREEPLDDEAKRRIAENESRFRAANEKIEDAGERFGAEQSALPFICECGRPTCVVVIRVTIPD